MFAIRVISFFCITQIGRKSLLPLFLLLFVSSEIAAQRDSLWQLVRAGKGDTSEVMWLIQLGEAYELTQPDSAIIIYNKARDLSEEIDFPLGYARYANAVAYPLELLDRLDEKDSILHVAIEICNRHGLRRELARKYHSLGISQQMLRNYEQASELYLKGLAIADELKDTLLFTAFYNNLGSVFKGLGQNDKAYEYIRRALDIHRAKGKLSGIASAQLNLGIIDLRNKNYDVALQRFNEALSISKDLNDYEGLLISHLNISDVLLVEGKYEATLPKLDSAYYYAVQLGAERYRMIVIQAKASALKLLKRPEEALKLLSEAEQMAFDLDEKERLATIHLDESDIYETLGDYKSALFHLRKSVAYKDSVMNRQIEENVNELEMKYATAKREKELLLKDAELLQQNSDKRFRGILLAASCFLILLLVVVLIQRQKINREKLESAHRAQQLELASLRERERSRIAADMHDDIGSGLTSIRLLSEVALRKGSEVENESELKKISARTSELVHKMSEIIWALNPNNDTLTGLISYSRAQLASLIEESGKAFYFEDLTEERQMTINGEIRRNIFLILKEAAHNAIKHSGSDSIRLRFELHHGRLIAAVADKGQFRKEGTSLGNGLLNMKRRAEAIGGSIEFNQDNGTEIQISVNIGA